MQKAVVEFRTIEEAPENYYTRDEWNDILKPGDRVIYEKKKDRMFFFNSYSVTYIDEPYNNGFGYKEESQAEELLLKALAVVANNRKLGE